MTSKIWRFRLVAALFLVAFSSIPAWTVVVCDGGGKICTKQTTCPTNYPQCDTEFPPPCCIGLYVTVPGGNQDPVSSYSSLTPFPPGSVTIASPTPATALWEGDRTAHRQADTR